jgi:hypothetical protein
VYLAIGFLSPECLRRCGFKEGRLYFFPRFLDFRFDSHVAGFYKSVTCMTEDDERFCRVCHGEDENDRPLHYPCLCKGSIKHIHQECLVEWLKVSGQKEVGVIYQLSARRN